MDRTTFLARLDEIKEKVLGLGAKIYSWEIGEPVSMELIRQIEEKYRLKLPADFVEMVTQTAGWVDVSWNIEDDGFWKKYPQVQEVSCGSLQWDIRYYLDEKKYQSYQYYSTHWEDMKRLLDFAEVPNGDMVLFDLAYPGEKKPVVYLNHDGLYTHPVQLAESFESYVEALLRIGLVGSEIWQLEKFIQPEPWEKDGDPSEPGVIDPECPHAMEWRKVIGLM